MIPAFVLKNNFIKEVYLFAIRRLVEHIAKIYWDMLLTNKTLIKCLAFLYKTRKAFFKALIQEV